MAANRREIDIAGKRLIIHEHDLSPDSSAGVDLGLGATVWDCAIILANYLPTYALTRPLPSFSVLELGAGTGLPALAAASLGAPRVTLTDRPHLVPGLARNVQSNSAGDGSGDGSGAIPASTDVRVAALEWGRDEQADALELRPFDLVLMSDLLYDVAAVGDLCRTLRRVCGRRTEVLLAYELRAGTTECFRVLREQGFQWERVPSQELHPVWQSDDIERLAWKGACFERQSAIYGLLHKPKWASNHRRLPLFFSDQPPTLWRNTVSVKGRWLSAVEKGRMGEEDECFQEVDRPLLTIADAFEELASSLHPGSNHLRLDEFCAACSLVSILFKCLGLAFKFAEMEYDHKVHELVEASKSYDTLSRILEHDVAQATVKKQGSLSRNLRRVRQGLDLIRALFEQFLSSDSLPLSEAASTAYAEVCAPYHSWAIRKAVFFGMYALPSREQLLFRLNETDHYVKREMKRYIAASYPIIQYIDSLYTQKDISLDW